MIFERARKEIGEYVEIIESAVAKECVVLGFITILSLLSGTWPILRKEVVSNHQTAIYRLANLKQKKVNSTSKPAIPLICTC